MLILPDGTPAVSRLVQFTTFPSEPTGSNPGFGFNEYDSGIEAENLFGDNPGSAYTDVNGVAAVVFKTITAGNVSILAQGIYLNTSEPADWPKLRSL